MTHVLIVEDERDLALGVRANLEVEGYTVSVASSGEEGLAMATSHRPDLILLDIMLPAMDGYEVLAALRSRGIDAPVLILSARAEEVDKVRGFRTGADDYVTKPFGVMELLVRIESLLRRRAPAAPPARAARMPAVQLGNANIDIEGHVVRRNGEELPLTPKALELFVALLQRRDKVVSRHELLREVWGYESDVTTRTVDAHVAELRKKIEDDPASPRHILTVWKVGYRLRLE